MATGPQPRAGGALLALCTLAGAGVGLAIGQPSAGVIAGTALGAGVALLLWWRDRARG